VTLSSWGTIYIASVLSSVNHTCLIIVPGVVDITHAVFERKYPAFLVNPVSVLDTPILSIDA